MVDTILVIPRRDPVSITSDDAGVFITQTSSFGEDHVVYIHLSDLDSLCMALQSMKKQHCADVNAKG